ncbi:MAG: ABC-type transport auxiliary lipoprotein family protein [Kangiellaceae bacterium]
MIRFMMWSVVFIFIAGCGSPAIKTHFYTLSKQAVKTQLIDSQQASNLIVIENIHLADYLRQSGIVVKESGSRLQISSNHRWAESLDGALSRSLRSEMESKLDNHRIELVNSRWQALAKFTIKLEIAQFEVDNLNGNAVHSGRYWILNDKGVLIGQRRFNLTLILNNNGFEHAVKQLQNSVIQLAELLSKDILQLEQLSLNE